MQQKTNSFSVVISAPSGAGKTTLIKRLISRDSRFQFSVSTTTRPIRKGEVDGESYHFISEMDFYAMAEAGEFIEWANVHGNLYGTTKKEVDRISSIGNIPLFDVDVQGGRSLRASLGKMALFVFIVPPSFEVLAGRLINRGTDSDQQIKLRLKNAVIEMGEYCHYDYIVVNDDLDTAVDDVRSIVTAELARVERYSGFISKIMEEGDDYTSR